MARLSGVKLLSALSPQDLAQVEQCCHWHRFRRGESIVERASENRDVYFIVEGEVEIINYSLSGRPVAYADLGPGAFFGELAAIDDQPRSASVMAKTDCLLGSLPPDRFIDLLRRHPDVALQVMRQLAAIIRLCDERIMDLATLGAMQRILVELLRAAQPDPITPGSWMIYPVPPQRETAMKAATTRETVARVFTQLQDGGLIRRKGRTLYLRDRAAIERMAQRLNPHGGRTLHGT